MSLKTFLASRITQRLTSDAALEKARAQAEARRQKTGAMHVVDYFHQADDPYSHLMVQMLEPFAARFDVRIAFHLVSPPPDWAAPDRQRLVAYSRRDAAVLAARAGLDFTDPGRQPDPAAVAEAESALVALIDGQQAVVRAPAISAALWRGAVPPTPCADAVRVGEVKAEGDRLRAAGGHYLGAMLHYGGEWYWGPDRLHYLEARLRGLGAGRPGTLQGALFPPPDVQVGPPPGPLPAGTDVHAYLSFRSPYTYLAAGRIAALCAHYGAALRPRFVLPMVMRGLEVPRTKARYILMDTAREARRLGIPFGKIADPVGRPVERGYAIMPYALAEGRGMDFCLSFLRAVWSEGVDAGSDSGLQKIVERAGLDWKTARGELGSDAWRAIEAENQEELLGLGIWGVPSFRVGRVAAWGQDRLWVIEDRLRALAAAEAEAQRGAAG